MRKNRITSYNVCYTKLLRDHSRLLEIILLKARELTYADGGTLYTSTDDKRLKFEIMVAKAKESGKPDNIIEKMVLGQIGKFYGEVCLLEQAYVIDPDQKVAARNNFV